MGDVAVLRPCAACGKASGRYAIHRDGLGEGPEVPLCEECGANETPTCEELWERIAERRKGGRRG